MNNNDDYAEVSVKGNSRKYMFQNRMKGLAIILLGLAVTYVSAVILTSQYFSIVTLIIALYICVCIPFGVQCMMNKVIEYDYLYMGSEIEIDAVLNQSKRVRKMVIHMDNVKAIAPKKSHALDRFTSQGNISVRDFTDGDEDKCQYALILEENNRLKMVVLEPNQHMVDMLRANNKEIFHEV